MNELIKDLHELANQVAELSPHLAMLIHKKANEVEDELMFNWEANNEVKRIDQE